MLKDKFKYASSGKISLYSISNGVKTKLFTRSNTILPNADVLVAQILSGNAAAVLSQIRLYFGATLRSNGAITSKVFNSLDNTVTFSVTFSDASFNGTINKAQLGPSDMITLGNFAESTFSTVTKAADEQLQVDWEIEFTTIIP